MTPREEYTELLKLVEAMNTEAVAGSAGTTNVAGSVGTTNVAGSAGEPQCSTQTVAEVIAESLIKQYEPYIEMTKVFPLLLPVAQEAINNMKSVMPLYEQFRDFARKELQDSVLLTFTEAKKVCESDDYTALELTKLVMTQNNRLSEVVKQAVNNKQATDKKTKQQWGGL